MRKTISFLTALALVFALMLAILSSCKSKEQNDKAMRAVVQSADDNKKTDSEEKNK